MKNAAFPLLLVLAAAGGAHASILDFNEWTLIEDPPNDNMTSVVDSPTQVTLTTSDTVPFGVDIGRATVNGPDVASSTQGFFFDPGSDFRIAVDFRVSDNGSLGTAAIGFGIGEDTAGRDSAGITLQLVNGEPNVFLGAARVDDDLQAPAIFPPMDAVGSGRFFVDYLAASKAIVVGYSTTSGANAPDDTRTLSGVATQWDNEPLLASFFLRSEGSTGGELEAVFGNFDVLIGRESVVPEPTGAALLTLAALASLGRRRG